MTIDRILYINLKRRTDRHRWFQRNMKNAGVPMEIVKRIPGKDWQDYSDCEHILEAMRADGFAPFNTPEKWKRENQHRGHFCYVWSYCIVLREIIESNETTLVLHDDTALCIPWDELLERLASLPEELYLCQLDWFYHDKWQNSVDIYSADPRWAHGIRSMGETAIIYKKWGAKRMLALAQGCIEELNSIEGIVVRHFNNRYVFHSTTSNIIQQFPRAHTHSDIDPRQNPYMRYEG